MVIKRTQQAKSAVTPQVMKEENTDYEQTLRPQRISEYVGQAKIKGHLLVHIEAARTRSEPLGHTLLHGPPGLGKTTLAHIVAKEMSAQIRITNVPVLEKPGDLASILT